MAKSTLDKAELLRECRAFAYLRWDALLDVASIAKEVFLKHGAPVVRHRNLFDHVNVLFDGSVSLAKREEMLPSIASGELRAPALIGGVELLRGLDSYRATYRVSSPRARVLRLGRADVDELLRNNPDFRFGLLRLVASTAETERREVQARKKIWTDLEQLVRHVGDSLGLVRQVASAVSPGDSGEERRYLVSLADGGPEHYKTRKRLRQAYLALDEGESKGEIRIRTDGTTYTVTGKMGAGRRTRKVEMPISGDLYERLASLAAFGSLSKTRYEVEADSLLWKVDVYDAGTPCEGLVLAEVDVPDDKGEPIPPPGVSIVEDISGDDRYKNRNLARFGSP